MALTVSVKEGGSIVNLGIEYNFDFCLRYKHGRLRSPARTSVKRWRRFLLGAQSPTGAENGNQSLTEDYPLT